MSDVYTPVFNFDGEVTSAEELDNLTTDTNKVFRPGKRELEVTEVRPIGPARSDKSWHNYLVMFRGVGKEEGKVITRFVLIPGTGKLTYTNKGGKESGWAFKGLRDFMAALGVDLTAENVKKVLPSYFSPRNLNALVGKRLMGEIGFRGTHAKYIATSEDSGYIALVKDGDILMDTNGDAISFESYEEAESYAKENSINDYEAFPELISVEPLAASGSDGVAGW